jgi:glucose/arabinose dehydrogenase
MLRIDVDAAQPYGIPPDNPFANRQRFRPEIWATGLRNPWRYSFDRATGDLYIADVGQNEIEEVEVEPPGAGGRNYGWNIMEGSRCFRAANCDRNGLTLPVAEYDHSQGCSITGGYVYRGTQQPALYGGYFYGDYCSGRIWSLHRARDRWTSTQLLQEQVQISSFGEDEAGEIYVAGLSDGVLYRLTAK